MQPVNLLREHRHYLADWLMRFYDFDVQEIVAGGQAGMLDEFLDPKLAWALKRHEQFPIDINRAERDRLLRIPGRGTRGVNAYSRVGPAAFCALRISRKFLDLSSEYCRLSSHGTGHPQLCGG